VTFQIENAFDILAIGSLLRAPSAENSAIQFWDKPPKSVLYMRMITFGKEKLLSDIRLTTQAMLPTCEQEVISRACIPVMRRLHDSWCR
jgi:hypothetical protein